MRLLILAPIALLHTVLCAPVSEENRPANPTTTVIATVERIEYATFEEYTTTATVSAIGGARLSTWVTSRGSKPKTTVTEVQSYIYR